MKLKYKSLQIIKHALQYYIQRECADEDIEVEKHLLERVTEEVDTMKEKYRI